MRKPRDTVSPILRDLLRTLRYIARHEPSLDEAAHGLGISRPTIVRHLRAARTDLKMTILSIRGPGTKAHHYHVSDFGLIDSKKFLT